MSILRPGGIELTKYALQAANIKQNGRLLDIGCGDGTVASYIKENCSQEVVAIDIDECAVEKAKRKGVDARLMNASALEFDCWEFDTVMMECVFTVIGQQEEALHEAYCVLRAGGNIIISDLYCKNPDMDRWSKDYRNAMEQFRNARLHHESEHTNAHEKCGHIDHIPSPYCQDGAVVLKGLTDLLEEIGFEITFLEDHTSDLTAFVGQAIMEYGSLDEWFQSNGTWKPCVCRGKKKDIGYFLLVAHKKEE